MLLTELKKQVNKMGILGRVAMKRDEYWQLILGRLRKLENDINFVDEVQIETATTLENKFKLREGVKSVIIGFDGVNDADLLLPDDPTNIKNNVFITVSDSTGALNVKTVSDLLICRYIDTQDAKYILSTSSLHLIPCDTYYFGVTTF